MKTKPFCTFTVASVPVGTPHVAEVEIAGSARARSLLATSRSRPHAEGTPGADAAEYLQLAVKRWRYYFSEGYSPQDLADARRRITTAPDCELGFLLTAQAGDTTRTEAGFCFLRRVWTGRFVVDFLSVHPSTFHPGTGQSGFSGTGVGFLAAAAKLTLELGGSGFWGEATRNSHGFYRRIKAYEGFSNDREPVTDHFRFEGNELSLLMEKFLHQKSS